MKTAEFYNRFYPFYFLVDAALSQHKSKLVEAVNECPKGQLLEVGVGSGNYLKHYLQSHITAIDFSEKMIAAARKNNTTKINFHLLEAHKIERLNTTFDTIVFAHVLSTAPKPNEMITTAINHLNSNGRVIILNHFSSNKILTAADKLFQPLATMYHFQSYFPLEKLTALKALKLVKASKFGILKSHQLLVFEKY